MAGARLLTEDQRAALARIVAACDAIRESRMELERAIKAASDAGCSLRSIEEVAQMSHERVRQIILRQLELNE